MSQFQKHDPWRPEMDVTWPLVRRFDGKKLRANSWTTLDVEDDKCIVAERIESDRKKQATKTTTTNCAEYWLRHGQATETWIIIARRRLERFTTDVARANCISANTMPTHAEMKRRTHARWRWRSRRFPVDVKMADHDAGLREIRTEWGAKKQMAALILHTTLPIFSRLRQRRRRGLSVSHNA